MGVAMIRILMLMRFEVAFEAIGIAASLGIRLSSPSFGTSTVVHAVHSKGLQAFMTGVGEERYDSNACISLVYFS